MKCIFRLALTTVFLLGFAGIVTARLVRIWTYQELVEKSDLVVLASPVATNDTAEHINHPDFVGQPVIGVETRFAVAAVLKGDSALKEFTFHHYRTGTDGVIVPNGPMLVCFDPVERTTFRQRTFILFLHREADGRYASVVGQSDPGGGIKELR